MSYTLLSNNSRMRWMATQSPTAGKSNSSTTFTQGINLRYPLHANRYSEDPDTSWSRGTQILGGTWFLGRAETRVLIWGDDKFFSCLFTLCENKSNVFWKVKQVLLNDNLLLDVWPLTHAHPPSIWATWPVCAWVFAVTGLRG